MSQKTRIGFWGTAMAKTCANLDALIMREDLFAKDKTVQSVPPPQSLKVSELEPNSLWFKSLRKPDFQRETASWEPEKIKDLILSFVKGHFIPALILWRSEDGKIFVIDGAHRLSALIAWATDDYGDKDASIRFFKNEITEQQKKIADRTRTLVRDAVGEYSEMAKIIDNPHSDAVKVLYARNAGTQSLSIQWVTGSAETAEESFKTINQSSTPIDATEFQMIVSRQKPNAIATRALMRKGVGHEYWKQNASPEIVKVAIEIYDMLFTPPLERPIKTLDLPVAGEGYSAETVRLIFDFVNLVNGLVISQHTLKEIPNDADGSQTIAYLRRVADVISIICSKKNNSLGLHPAVYFYSHSGRYQPTAFLATVSLVEWLRNDQKEDNEKDFFWFTKHRKQFEDFLLSHRFFVNDIVNQFGSGLKGYSWVLKLYKEILFQVSDGKDSDIAKNLINADKWRLKERAEGPTAKTRVSGETKTFVILRDCLANAIVCKICGARIHRNSLQVDHVQRRVDGGSDYSNNLQLSHPFCNTTYKETLAREPQG